MQKEFLIREFLERHLSRSLNIDRGFIRRLDLDEVSPEIDVLIADPSRHVPIFREGGLQIVPPSCVVATLEVKSTYRQSVLNEALENVLKVRKLLVGSGSAEGVFSAIVVATIEKKLDARELLRAIKQAACAVENKTLLEAEPVCERRSMMMPNVIGILDNGLALLEHDAGTGSLVARVFQADDASAAFIFAHLFSFLRQLKSENAIRGELELMLESVEGLDFCVEKFLL